MYRKALDLFRISPSRSCSGAFIRWLAISGSVASFASIGAIRVLASRTAFRPNVLRLSSNTARALSFAFSNLVRCFASSSSRAVRAPSALSTVASFRRRVLVCLLPGYPNHALPIARAVSLVWTRFAGLYHNFAFRRPVAFANKLAKWLRLFLAARA